MRKSDLYLENTDVQKDDSTIMIEKGTSSNKNNALDIEEQQMNQFLKEAHNRFSNHLGVWYSEQDAIDFLKER